MAPLPDPNEPMFKFQPRWKEEMVVTSKDGAFVIDLAMGNLTAYLLPEDLWREQAPDWAKEHWPQLKRELEAWCEKYNAKLAIDVTAVVMTDPPAGRTAG